MAKPVWLITGGSGQVGGALRDNLPVGVAGWFPTRTELDLAAMPSLPALIALLRDHHVACIINSAAYTAVDRAESEEVLAQTINGEAPALLALAARALNIPIIQISTDYVFSGDREGAWHEEDPLAPINAYGRTKLAGELAVSASGARHIILRTAWVVSDTGSNFIKTMLRLGAERESLGVVSDQIGCPTSAKDIAQTCVILAQAILADPAKPSGVYHFVNDGHTSWHGLAEFVFDRAATQGFTPPKLDAIATSAYPTPAKRPVNSRLAVDKIKRDFSIIPRDWQSAIGEIVYALMKEQESKA